jgi:hypothetical protein
MWQASAATQHLASAATASTTDTHQHRRCRCRAFLQLAGLACGSTPAARYSDSQYAVTCVLGCYPFNGAFRFGNLLIDQLNRRVRACRSQYRAPSALPADSSGGPPAPPCTASATATSRLYWQRLWAPAPAGVLVPRSSTNCSTLQYYLVICFTF